MSPASSEEPENVDAEIVGSQTVLGSPIWTNLKSSIGGLFIAAILAANLAWILTDNAPMRIEDAYGRLTNLLIFLDELEATPRADLVPALHRLSAGGRPTIYQILTTPFIFLFGRSEDSALLINTVLMAILAVSTFHIGKLVKNKQVGLLASLLAVTYPPIVHLSRMYAPASAVPTAVTLSVWLLLVLLRDRSVKSAWFFFASVAFGLQIHPYFLDLLFIPSSLFIAYTIIRGSKPQFSGQTGFGAWLRKTIRDPFFFRGILPSAAAAVAINLAWYFVFARKLLELKSERALEEQLYGKLSLGFPGVEPSFWWYLKTAPGAISTIFAILPVIGIAYVCVRKPRLPIVVLLVFLVGGYTAKSLGPHLAWLYTAPLLPVAAVFSVIWIVDVRPRLLRLVAAGSCVLIALFCFFVISWKMPGQALRVAKFLGAPVDSPACRLPRSLIFCPVHSHSTSDSTEDVVSAAAEAILNESRCGKALGCKVTLAGFGEIKSNYLRYHAVKGRKAMRMRIRGVGRADRGQPFPLEWFLESDLIIVQYSKGGPRATRRPVQAHNVAAINFALSPPEEFTHNHRSIFKYPDKGGRVVEIIERIHPLTSSETDQCAEALGLRGKD